MWLEWTCSVCSPLKWLWSVAQKELEKAEPCHFPEFLGLENRMIHEKCGLKIQQDSCASLSVLYPIWTHVHGWAVITVLPNETNWREWTKHNTKAGIESICIGEASFDLRDGESKPLFRRKCLKIFSLWRLVNIKFLTSWIWNGLWMLVLEATLLVNTLSQACHRRIVRYQASTNC